MLTKNDLFEALQPIHKKLDELEAGQKVLEAGQKRIEKKLDQSIEDNAALFHQTWTYIDEIKLMLEKRIDKIEKQVLHS